MWYDKYDDDDDGDYWFTECDDGNKFFKWYEIKIKEAKIKEELLPIAWHPSRQWDWCVPEDEKEDAEKLWA